MDAEAELSDALDAGDTATIVALIGTNVNVELPDGRHGMQTPLMRLCRAQDADRLVGLLLGRSPDVNAVDATGCTALAHACVAGRVEAVGRLAGCGRCDPDVADRDGVTPLMYAVRARRVDIVRAVLEGFLPRGIDVHRTNHKGMCALREAELHHDSEICRLLVELGGADVTRMRASAVTSEGARSARSATPDAPITVARRASLLSNQRRDSHRGREVALSPLVTNGRTPVSVPTGGGGVGGGDGGGRVCGGDGGDLPAGGNATPAADCLSALIEEPTAVAAPVAAAAGEEDNRLGAGVDGGRSRPGSVSLPDLAAGRSLVSSSASLSSDGSAIKPNTGRRSHGDVSLPLLREIDEEAFGGTAAPPSDGKLRRRKNSLSLPDLRQDASVVCGQHRLAQLGNGSRHLATSGDNVKTNVAVKRQLTNLADVFPVVSMLNMTRQNISSQFAQSLPSLGTSRRHRSTGFANKPLGVRQCSPVVYRRAQVAPTRSIPPTRLHADQSTLAGLHLAGTKLNFARYQR